MVLTFVDHSDSEIKKSSYEVLSYGAALAEKLDTSAEALLLGTVKDDLAALGNYGVSKVHQVSNEVLNNLDAQVYANAVADAATSLNADVIIFSHKFKNGRSESTYNSSVFHGNNFTIIFANLM